MSTALQELNSFHEFAVDSLRSRNEDVSLERLLAIWRARQEREEVNAAIRRGLADVEAGRVIPADQFLADFDKKHGLSRQ
jgi:predicted transcriptional regulator